MPLDFQGIATVIGATGVFLGVLVTSIASIVNLIKTAKVEAHVNSQSTKFQEQILSLSRENEILKGVILDKVKVSELLAQAQSHVVANAANTRIRSTDSPLISTEKVVDKVVEKLEDKTLKVETIETEAIVNKGKK